MVSVSDGKVTFRKEGTTFVYATIGKNKYEVKLLFTKTVTVTVHLMLLMLLQLNLL